MTQVKSPYNFVPLNKKVFTPEWGKFVSQDIPFKDGLSGKIKLKIKAHTPIFVRGEGIEKEKIVNGETKKYTEYHFFKHNGKYCIPGTSIKGEISNVMEIMSFGRLKLFNDSKYSLRDFDNPQLYDKSKFSNSLGGFLEKSGDKFIIRYNNEVPGRISHEQLDKDFKGISFVEEFKKKDNKKWNKSAVYKYKLFENNPLKNSFDFHYQYISKGQTLKYKKVYKKGDDKEGIIVFTGQASLRSVFKKNGEVKTDNGGNTKGKGKHFEFIFWTPNQSIEVDKQVIDDFFFAYFDHEPKSQSADWKHWKAKLENGENIPVFFKLENNKVKHLGLSQLYKLPYEYRVKDLVPNEHNNLDLVDYIFGFTINNKEKKEENENIKGRVSIEPAIISNNKNELRPVTTILGSPKASYYPFYLNQDVKDDYIVTKYNTYNDKTVIAGRKRYPVKKNVDINHENSESPGNTTVTFLPIDKGVEFKTIIHYHNLRPVELGALLSAITFHNNNETYHHSIGMAKPLGYGNVTFDIDFKESNIEKDIVLDYMCMYEKMMNNFYNQYINSSVNWVNSEQIKELFTLSLPVENDEKLRYMELKDFSNLISGIYEKEKDCKERLRLDRKCKKEEKIVFSKPNKALPRYTKFNNFISYPKSLINEDCDFDSRSDILRFKIDNNSIQKFKDSHIQNKQEELFSVIESKISELGTIIAGKKADEVIKQGIQPLLEQNSMKRLISQTRTWAGKYYKGKEKPIILIPNKYLNAFMAHIDKLYNSKTNDRVWKHKKDYKKSVGYKYLVKAIGKDKAEKWYKENQSNKK